MAKATLKQISKFMRGIDYAMLTTVDGRGNCISRPMSNNRNVDYDGTSYFFTYANTPKVREIKKNPKVCLQYTNINLFADNVFISISGTAKLTTDRREMEKHYSPELKAWFPQGLDTKGIMLISVKAKSIHYWKGFEEGEFAPKKSKTPSQKARSSRKRKA